MLMGVANDCLKMNQHESLYQYLLIVLYLVVYLGIVSEPNIVSDRIKAILDDPEHVEHIKNSQLKQIKR